MSGLGAQHLSVPSPGWIEEPEMDGALIRRLLAEHKTQDGRTIAEQSDDQPFLLIFLRHFS